MIEKHLLAPFDGNPNETSLLCPFSSPALVGGGEIDWHCYRCDTLLLKGIYERQVLNLLVRCYKCEAISATPQREPGEPLPFGKTVMMPPGQYKLMGQVDALNKLVLLVGSQAVDGYKQEIGWEPLSHMGISLGHPEISADFLRILASEASLLLGDRFIHLRNADKRGKLSSTPPASRHRLIELIDNLTATAAAFDGGNQTVNGDFLSELFTCVSLFNRWKHHPAYMYLKKALIDGAEVQHTIMVLAVASYLADAGNGVGIIFRQSTQRIPDLWVVPSLAERLDLEVKTPTELRGPRKTMLTSNDAEKIILRQLKKAASSGGGQLDPHHSGVLAIGGFHLGNQSFDVLTKAAARVLASQTSKKKHLIAILIMELSFVQIPATDPTTRYNNRMFQPVLRAELIRHPGYQGNLNIRSDVRPQVME